MAFRILLLITSIVLPAVSGKTIQKPGLKVPDSARTQRDAAEKLFVTSYTAYKNSAFGHDDVLPGSKSFSDFRNGWGATVVDAMSTMYVMGLNDLFSEAVDFAGKIDFTKSKTRDTVSVFETTIRYLGGLLSSYELSEQRHPELLAKAKELADKLSFAWVGNNDLPFGFVDFQEDSAVKKFSNIAEAGTLVMEWGALSKATGNDTYRTLAEKAMKHIANLQAPLPGLAAQQIDPSSGNFLGDFVTWGGGSDSYFEYLIKYARLTNTDDSLFADTWKLAVGSSISTLMRTSTIGNHVYLADQRGGRISHSGSHLACFNGGNWIMGGNLVGDDSIVRHGLDLADACWNTYASTATGIGPETFFYTSSDGDFNGGNRPSDGDTAFYNKNGFWIGSSAYILRPEVLESNFYAWRATGDTKYLDRAASALKSFQTYLPFGDGFGGLNDVNNVTGSKVDDMESFWFAETLKYLYLTFDDPAHISLDEYVFNTEAQPFKAPAALNTYGSNKPTSRIKSGSTAREWDLTGCLAIILATLLINF